MMARMSRSREADHLIHVGEYQLRQAQVTAGANAVFQVVLPLRAISHLHSASLENTAPNARLSTLFLQHGVQAYDADRPRDVLIQGNSLIDVPLSITYDEGRVLVGDWVLVGEANLLNGQVITLTASVHTNVWGTADERVKADIRQRQSLVGNLMWLMGKRPRYGRIWE
jgi:hypothetical protein